MCRFLSMQKSQEKSDTELYNSFLFANSLEDELTANEILGKKEREECWCRFEEFARLRKLPKDVLSILGGVI